MNGIDIIGSIRTAIGRVFFFVLSGIMGAVVVIVAPVLAVVLPIYVIHTGDVENIRLLSKAYLLIGPLSASFYFSCVWKGFRKDAFWDGILGAAGRMTLGFILSAGCMIVVGLHLHTNSASTWFVFNFFAISAPVVTMAIIQLTRKNESSTSVCFLCDGRVRGTSCSKCHADYSIV